MTVDEVKELYNLDWVQIINDQLENPVSIFLAEKYRIGEEIFYFWREINKWQEKLCFWRLIKIVR